MTPDTERAWAAGFFDGEGSSGCYALRGIQRLRVSVGQIDPRVLERFRNAVGVGAVSGPRARTEQHCSPVWTFSAHSLADCIAVFEAIGPWLSPVKTAQWTAALTAYLASPHPGRGRWLKSGELCRKGLHDLRDANNVAYLTKGRRQCRPCKNTRARERYAR